jgi:hypothetical protein
MSTIQSLVIFEKNCFLISRNILHRPINSSCAANPCPNMWSGSYVKEVLEKQERLKDVPVFSFFIR